jgi:hypothetical protein
MGSRVLIALALALIALGCSVTEPIRPPVAPPIVPPALDPAPVAPAAPPSEVAKLRALLAAAEAAEVEQIKAERAAAQAVAEAPLRSMLSWSQWAGGALLILGVLALGLSLSPWGRWIPGGTGTAATVSLTGVGVTVAARSLAAVLDLAWLPWAILACGVLAVVCWVAYLAIRATARHADRVEPATTAEAIAEAKRESAAEQAQAGVRGVIALARAKLFYKKHEAAHG